MKTWNYIQNQKLIIFLKLNYLILLFVFLAPIKPYLGKKVLLLTFFLWLLSVNYKDLRTQFKNSKTLQYIFIFFIYILLSLLWSENMYEGLKWIEKNTIYFFLPILIIVSLKDNKLVQKIIITFIFSMMINEIISYGIFFNFIDSVFGFKVSGTPSNPLPFQVSHIPYSVYISFAILISLYKVFFLKKSNIYFNIITILFIITMTINLFLSSGRTGQFTILMSIVSLLIIYQRKNIKRILLSILAILIIFSIAYNFGTTFHNRVQNGINDLEKITYQNNFNSSFGVRIGSFILFPKLIEETNILIGTGIGDIQDVVLKNAKEYFGTNSVFAVQRGLLHNTFLELFLTYGIIGFFLVLIIFYNLFKINLIEKEYIYLRYILTFSIIFSGISANMFTFKEFMFLYSIFIAVIIKIELDSIPTISSSTTQQS